MASSTWANEGDAELLGTGRAIVFAAVVLCLFLWVSESESTAPYTLTWHIAF